MGGNASLGPLKHELRGSPCEVCVNIHVVVQQFVWVLDHLLESLDADLAISEDQGILVRGADVV